MNRLDMTTEEAEMVQVILRSYLTTLDMEIDHTDRRRFKEMLLDRRHKTASLLERCCTPSVDDGPRGQDATESH